MTSVVAAPTGWVRVVAVGDTATRARGRASEFRHHGLALASRPTASAALVEVAREPSSVVLVPTSLADMPILDFVDVVRSLAHSPVLVGVGHGVDASAVSALFDHGATGTVALPLTPSRLAHAVDSTRPRDPGPAAPVECGHLRLHPAEHRVTWRDIEVKLGPKEFEVLQYLMEAHPRVVSLSELVGEFEAGSPDHAMRIRVAVGRLRAKFMAAGASAPIETLHRVGYRLTPE